MLLFCLYEMVSLYSPGCPEFTLKIRLASVLQRSTCFSFKGVRPPLLSKRHVNPGVDFLLSTLLPQLRRPTVDCRQAATAGGSGSMLLGLLLPLHPTGLFLPALLSYTEELYLAV